jgi:hypothetical protein
MESRPPYGGDSQRLGVRYGSKADPSVANADVRFGSNAAVLRLAPAREAGRVKAKQCASSRRRRAPAASGLLIAPRPMPPKLRDLGVIGGKLQFLASALLIALGMWIRLTVVESPIFPTSTRGVSMLPGS